MSTEPVRLAVVIGSVREGRFGPTVAHWIADEARKRPEFDVDLIDLADARLDTAGPTAEPGSRTKELLREVSPRLAAADAFTVVTPEYNHSFPAGLKNLIDWHHSEWHAKPVGFVSYGGISGGLRAVEQLRLVFAELHAVTVRDTVSFHMAWERFGEDGRPTDPEGHGAAAKTLLDSLYWWADALREARRRQPYAA
ncbi:MULTISPECIES: NADPH-dependent FMN reductase [Streptomyces]|uniref:NAD(P)H-dependent oxidoreductase n=1 Tax=Streptomyces lycii TaxID=2654337 RepID=A0ABQ7FGD6_9ACTN|nr:MULTISPECIES: NAD(P)H-dependent oxidoreductase [Streptomyces]KAF4408099.1 NAD(P)H-dependent oxidoreductase [Streptomyces lycii]PGH49469.1 NADPH-dependent FMN reductase [Streptomyces sp. Ru87]